MALRLVLVALLGCALIHNSTAVPKGLLYQCPSDDIPGPCECDGPYKQVIFKCKSLKNRHELKTAIDLMKGYGITEFELENSNMSHIPRDLFQHTAVDKIRIKKSSMMYLFDGELENVHETLVELTVDSVNFKGGLDWSILQNLGFLQILSFSNCNLDMVLGGIEDLDLPVETLLLSNNRISSVHEQAFQKLKDLKNLKLNYNRIQNVKRSMLSSNSRLQFLDLSYNQLSSLPKDMFSGLKELHSLILRGNAFKVLEKTYMKDIFPQLFFFDVVDNPLECDCELSWVLSEKKPYHFFGQCSKKDSKFLSELTSDDFAHCQ